MAIEQTGLREVVDVFREWHEFCRAVTKGEGPPADELFVARPVGHPSSKVLAVVDPDTAHISVLGLGLYPKLRELHRLALHAFRSGLGDVLFPPLVVRLGGVETRFRYAGHASVFAFADTGTTPRSKDRAVVLAALPSGFTLMAIHFKRALVIAQGRLGQIAGLDLDRMKIWEKLPATDYDIAHLRTSDLAYVAPGFSMTADKPDQPGARAPRKIRPKSHGIPVGEDPARLEATLVAALQASVIDEIPPGQRGRRELSDFLVDMVRLAVRGEPDLRGSSNEIALRMGKALGCPPRSARATNTCLGLLEDHGERHKNEVLVSRPTPHRWIVHLSDLVDPDGSVRISLFSRWSALHAVLVADHEPVSEEEVTRMEIRGGLGGAVVKKRHEIPYMFDSTMVSEYNLRRERETELMQLRVRHAEELRGLGEDLAQVRQQLEEAVAENTRRAAQVADADARLERLQEQATVGFERLAALAAEADILNRNKELVRSLHDAVGRRDASAVEALLAPGFIHHDPISRAPVDRADFMRRLLHDMEKDRVVQEHVDFFVAEDDLVAVHLRRNNGPALAAPPRIYRVVDNLIAEAWGWVLARPDLVSHDAVPVEDGGRVDHGG